MRVVRTDRTSGLRGVVSRLVAGLSVLATLAAPAGAVANDGPAARRASTICARDRLVLIGHADGFETDYWPSSDARVVSHHDAFLDRMINGSGRVRSRSWSNINGLRNVSAAPVARFVEV